MEYVPAGTERVGAFFAGSQLNFVLKAGKRAVTLNDKCRYQQHVIDDTLGAEDDGNVGLRGSFRNSTPSMIEPCLLRR